MIRDLHQLNFYKYFKEGMLLSSVGIVPVNSLYERSLLFIYFLKKEKIFLKNEFYNCCKLVNLPSSVGIVPEILLSEKNLELKNHNKLNF